MIDFLIFTLYSPLASWGEIAVGETRSSWDRPGRSAVLGFVAAALGLERVDTAGQTALDSGYGLAVRLDAAGTPMSDYHTAQTVSASVARRNRPRTRAELLDAGDRETILSRRTYREDALATVALWARIGARWKLQEIAAAIRHPSFVLYAGRKSNALGLPANPEIVSAGSLAEALLSRTHDRLRTAIAVNQLRLTDRPEIAHDVDPTVPSGLRVVRREVRRDSPTDRIRWQFAERVVDVGRMEVTAGAGEDR